MASDTGQRLIPTARKPAGDVGREHGTVVSQGDFKLQEAFARYVTPDYTEHAADSADGTMQSRNYVDRANVV